MTIFMEGVREVISTPMTCSTLFVVIRHLHLPQRNAGKNQLSGMRWISTSQRGVS